MKYKTIKVFNNIWLGSTKNALDSEFLKKNNISNIINLTKDITNKFYFVKYLRIPILNKSYYANLFKSYIDYSIFFIKKALSNNESLLIFSNENILPVILLVIYLMKTRQISSIDALCILENKLKIDKLKDKIIKNEISI